MCFGTKVFSFNPAVFVLVSFLLEIKIRQDLDDICAQHPRPEIICLLVLPIKENLVKMGVFCSATSSLG